MSERPAASAAILALARRRASLPRKNYDGSERWPRGNGSGNHRRNDRGGLQ